MANHFDLWLVESRDRTHAFGEPTPIDRKGTEQWTDRQNPRLYPLRNTNHKATSKL